MQTSDYEKMNDDDISNTLIGGMTVGERDQKWVPILGGLYGPLSTFRYHVGLWRVSLHGEIVGLGMAGEWDNGGFRKRLSDFTRPGWSGRDHKMGRLIYEHRYELNLELLILGSDSSAACLAKELVPAMIALHRPKWSVPPSIQEAAAAEARRPAAKIAALRGCKAA